MIFRYHPGTVLLVGVATALGSACRRRSFGRSPPNWGSLGWPCSSVPYAPTALVTRICTRRLPERFGLPSMILSGMGLMVVSLLLFLPVTASWQLILPGVRLRHRPRADLPADDRRRKSDVSESLPRPGTMLALAAYDVGVLDRGAAGRRDRAIQRPLRPVRLPDDVRHDGRTPRDDRRGLCRECPPESASAARRPSTKRGDEDSVRRYRNHRRMRFRRSVGRRGAMSTLAVDMFLRVGIKRFFHRHACHLAALDWQTWHPAPLRRNSPRPSPLPKGEGSKRLTGR